ncbi:MAG: hypothetical protein GVY02_05020 [Bacteroidetes bacterium]|jgi:hypothetical protein|nr:hypothetical protein [Bacteroidota bacterium]
MMNAAKKVRRTPKSEPVLLSIFKKAEEEYKKVEQMFSLVGWEGLPDELKVEIEDDVRGYIEELEGRFSTHCPMVQRRRESVDFWVNSYIDGICTLETAVNALKIKKL